VESELAGSILLFSHHVLGRSLSHDGVVFVRVEEVAAVAMAAAVAAGTK